MAVDALESRLLFGALDMCLVLDRDPYSGVQSTKVLAEERKWMDVHTGANAIQIWQSNPREYCVLL